jgi:hypothetical protein
MYPSEKVYTDYPADDIASLPATQVHRAVDLELEKADAEGESIATIHTLYLLNDRLLQDTSKAT